MSLGSLERQTGQRQPIIGTPCDVPEPSTVTFSLDAEGTAGDMDSRMPAGTGISRSKREFHLSFRQHFVYRHPSMRLLAALGALCFLVMGNLVHAQIAVSAQTQRTDFLLYERVDLLVTVVNQSESDITLDNNEGHPWLSFMVSKENRLPVHSEQQASFKAITLKVGQSKTIRVNLTPLFAFREVGNYKASAVIDLPGADPIVSENVPFSVLPGRVVWTESRPVDGLQRVYSLIRFSPVPNTTSLYLRVEDPDENEVLANLGLGEIVAYVDPDVFFDPQGNIHVMQPISMGTYLYSRADATGKVEHQGIFKTYQAIRPRLSKLDDGSVIVLGGLEQNPNTPVESLADGQKKGQTPIATGAPNQTGFSPEAVAPAAPEEPPVGSAPLPH